MVTPTKAFKWSAGKFSQNEKQIEENKRQSQIIAGERLPL